MVWSIKFIKYRENKLVTTYAQNVRIWLKHNLGSVLAIGQLYHQSATAPRCTTQQRDVRGLPLPVVFDTAEVHPSLISDYKSHKDNTTTRILKKSAEPASCPTATKKMRVQALLTAGSSSRAVSQEEVDQLVTRYIVKATCSLSTVEKESFIDVVEGLAPGWTVLTRRTLSVNIYYAHKSMIDRLKTEMESTKYVCTTADIWSTNNKSYLGMTAHWIDCL